MKHSIVLLIAIFASLSAIILASGCTTGAGGPTAAPSAASPTPVVATTGSLFDHSRFTWYQYNISSSDMMGMSMVHTYRYTDETLDGQPAHHVNITEDMRPDTLVYLDIWSTPSDGSTLKMHESAYRMDKLKSDADIDAANYTQLEGEDLASPKFSSVTLTADGTEAVAVGNKSYAATKYAGGTRIRQYAYWISPDVPVPVKLTVHDAKTGVDTTYELIQWGAGRSVAPTISAQTGTPAMDMPGTSQ